MRRFLLAQSLTLLVLAEGTALAQAGGAPPSCRRSASASAMVGELATIALQGVAGQFPQFGYKSIQVNPASESPSVLPVYVIRDARVNGVDDAGCPLAQAPAATAAVDFDGLTVRGVCLTQQGRVLCSEQAIQTAFGNVQQQQSTLLFVLAHEIAHIALEHPGSFMDTAALIVEQSWSAAARRNRLREACERTNEQLERERRADAVAYKILQSALAQTPFPVDPLGTSNTVDLNTMQVVTGMSSLYAWDKQRMTDTSLEPKPELVCTLLKPGTPTTSLKYINASHPPSWTRIDGVAAAMQRFMNGRPCVLGRRAFGGVWTRPCALSQISMTAYQAQIQLYANIRAFCEQVQKFQDPAEFTSQCTK